MTRVSPTLGALAVAVLLAPGLPASAHDEDRRARDPEPHVVRRLRIGDNVEDITYVSSGRFRGQVAALDGWDVLGVRSTTEDDARWEAEAPEEAEMPHGVHKLFDVRGLGLGEDAPRGIEFVPTQRRFYFSSPQHVDRLYASDEKGRALPPLPVTYPAGVDPLTVVQFEALGYVPETAAAFPDHLLAITIRLPDFNSVIEFIRFDRSGGQLVGGTVVKEVAFDPLLPDGVTPNPLYTYIPGLQYVGSPDRLIVTPLDFSTNLSNAVWVVDFDGTFTGPVATIPETSDIESLAALPDGRMALTDYELATLTFLGPDFARLPEERRFGLGFGVNRPVGVAWNAETREFLVRVQGTSDRLVAFAPESRSPRLLVDFASDPRVIGGMGPVFLPALPGTPARIALASGAGFFRGVIFYDTQGNYLSRISTRGVVQPPPFSMPFLLTALPGGRFAYSNGQIYPTVEVIAPGGPDTRPLPCPTPPCPADPTSVLATEVDRIVLDIGQTPEHPAQIGGAIWFMPGEGGGLVAGNSLYDLGGNRLSQFDPAILGLNRTDDGTLITTGRFAGDFAVTEAESSTIVIFRGNPFGQHEEGQ